MKYRTLDEYIAEYDYVNDFDYLDSNGELQSVYITDKYVSRNNNEANELLKVLQSQGFDEYSCFLGKDKEIMQAFVDDLNKKSYAKAKENQKVVYSHYSLDACSHIFKCGDMLLYHLLRYENYEVNPGHGGKRQNAGRKSPFVGGTTAIRVSKYDKDNIKKLLDFLVESYADEKDIRDALIDVIAYAKLHIEDIEKSGVDMTEHRKNIELVQQLRSILPDYFSIVKD